MKIKKRLIFLPILILVLVTVLGVIFSQSKTKSDYVISKVEKRDIVEKVEASGTVNPVKTVSIGSQVSGLIKAIYVDYNSKVKKGELLAQIDPALLQAQVDEAKATLNAKKSDYQKAKSMLDYDKINYERYRTLYKKRYVSKDELDLAKATYLEKKSEWKSLKADIEEASATLQNNLTNLKYTKIISPVDGVVISREVDVGQTVAASFETPTLFSVAQDLTKMQIEVSVSEADIGKISDGQDVEYTLDGYPNDVFKGKVTQVRISPTTVSNVVTYTVIVSVDNQSNILKPGMTANVEIITNEKKGALCVENAAMRFTPTELTGGKKYETQGIWLLRKKKPVRVNIKTGITDSEYTEIISNDIQDGEDVIIGGSGSQQSSKNNMPKPPGML